MRLVSDAFYRRHGFYRSGQAIFFLYKIKQSGFAHKTWVGVCKKYDMIFVKLDVFRHR